MASKSDQNQVLDQELVETPSRFEKVEPQVKKKLRTLFLRTDVTLEVEGRQIHVNKQTLADHSPVFKGMFESDFKEKHMDNIPLPDKKFEDFEIFLSSFYYNEFQQTITGKNLSLLICSKTYHIILQRLHYSLPKHRSYTIYMTC